MPGTFGQVRHILFPYFNCMIPTNAGLVAGNAYLITIQLYQNTGRYRRAGKKMRAPPLGLAKPIHYQEQQRRS